MAAASSCGFFPKASRCSPDVAIEAAQKFGVDLVQHRSRVICDAEAELADAIFVFDRRGVEACEARFPKLRSKVHLLGSLDPANPLEIEDPYGGSAEQFVECYARVRGILQGLLRSAMKDI